jgi:hypothetical protein
MKSNIKTCLLFVALSSLFFSGHIRADESDLVWSTFLGGSDYDLGYGIVVDDTGYIYVTGVTTSDDFPQKTDDIDTTHGGRDVVVAKLHPTGDSLVFATLLGGSDDDEGKALFVDDSGCIYVAGVTVSDDFPTTNGAFDTIYNGSRDVILAKLNPLGSVLEYATFLGGSNSDWGKGLAVDDSGRAFVTGYTNSQDFPTTGGAFDTTYNGGNWDAFVAKLNVLGSALEYATFLGGADVDDGHDIALDALGHAYVTGNTASADFPTTVGAYDTTHNGGHDVFVTRFDPMGDVLGHSSFIGGIGADYGYSIALDNLGDVLITGKTSSADFPTTAGAYDTEHGGVTSTDAFVTKLHHTANALEYSTYLGGNAGDEGHGIALDNSGSAYLTGYTWSTDFPTTAGAYSTSHSGYSSDAFVAKLNPAGSHLEYATFLGGNAVDYGRDIFLDGSGFAYTTGETKSSDFPTTPGAYSTSITGHYADIFVAKLNLEGTPVGSVTSEMSLPEGFALSQNSPNPFNASTKIRYQIPADAHVNLKVFNALGQETRTLVEAEQKAHSYTVTWDGRNNVGQEVASGLYFCCLKARGFEKTIKMLLVK